MIRLRTQYRNISLTVMPDGELLINGTEVGRLFPDEVLALAALTEDGDNDNY